MNYTPKIDVFFTYRVKQTLGWTLLHSSFSIWRPKLEKVWYVNIGKGLCLLCMHFKYVLFALLKICLTSLFAFVWWGKLVLWLSLTHIKSDIRNIKTIDFKLYWNKVQGFFTFSQMNSCILFLWKAHSKLSYS